MLHDVLEVFIARQSRQFVGDCDLPVGLALVHGGHGGLGGEGVDPLVFGLEDLLDLLCRVCHCGWFGIKRMC